MSTCIHGVFGLYPQDDYEGFMCTGTARRHQPQCQRQCELRKREHRLPWAWAASSEGASHMPRLRAPLLTRLSFFGF